MILTGPHLLGMFSDFHTVIEIISVILGFMKCLTASAFLKHENGQLGLGLGLGLVVLGLRVMVEVMVMVSRLLFTRWP